MLSVVLSIQVVDVSLWTGWVSLDFLGIEVVRVDDLTGKRSVR